MHDSETIESLLPECEPLQKYPVSLLGDVQGCWDSDNPHQYLSLEESREHLKEEIKSIIGRMSNDRDEWIQ